ncbi:MAG: microcin C ABC transporter permease YejB [Alphaproteobacteria bacterium]|nr:microcin C ABC transporter permease YejB [Alphaproteobacteria bacterium]NCQ87549.1 microcin C ABC transporter permease YejB [Alphaproteobacteria bacterium]NCT06417.1 microcin C ABC transporter permease YejB [Alphaproteobacteria bacterium]
MANYLLKRLLLMIPTLLGIMLISFIIVQFVPGGPVERMIAQLQGHGVEATARFGGGSAGGDMAVGSTGQSTGQSSKYRGSQGLDPQFVAELEAMYGFDKPAHERFFQMVVNYAKFDLGESYYQDKSVISLVLEKMPVSISLGLWSTLIIYLISIPLGIKKAVTDGQKFDIWTSAAVFTGYAIPSFMFAILLIVVFAGGRYFDIFPLRGLTSDGFDEMNFIQQVLDYLWHMVLPVAAMVISGFAGLTMLTKNSFLDEVNKQYVVTARAKGLEQNQVLYGHVFRNAMLIVIAGFPSAFLAIFFTGSLLIEVIFSLDGLGLLGYESVINRDYPVVLGTLYIFALMGLITTLIRDVVYVLVDPRIDFAARTV